MKKNIEKREALKAWHDPRKKVMLRSLYKTFDDYWKEISDFNLLSEEEKHIKIQETVKQIKHMRIMNSLRKAGLIVK